MESFNAYSAEQQISETELQQLRYRLCGKGGDGDPPYQKDMDRFRRQHATILDRLACRTPER